MSASGANSYRSRHSARRGLVLVVVLVMVALLALLAAAYSFMVRGHVATVRAEFLTFQARMAADSGYQRAIVMLRESAGDTDSWFDNPEEFRGLLVHGTDGEDNVDTRSDDVTYDASKNRAWRTTLYHPNYGEEEEGVLYGFTDEGSRLNLTTATEAQIRRLFEAVIPEEADNPVEIDVLVHSLMDWREPGGSPREHGAKDEFYLALSPGYRCKKAQFATIEELLLVRGFTGWVLFGEDYNRNGLLDPNENDGDDTFPRDNADGVLFQGVAPFLTVWSAEMNVSSDGRQRINLNMQDTQKLQESLEEDFSGDIVSYVMQVRGSGTQFNSVMNLIPAPPPPEEEEGAPDGDENGLPALPATPQPDGEGLDGNPADSNGETTDPNGARAGSENDATPAAVVYQDLTAEPPPGTYDDLPLLLDRLTVNPIPGYFGRINVNTAPAGVIGALEPLTSEEVDAIVAARRNLESAEKTTPAWLLTQSLIDETKFRQILDSITTGSSVFRVDAIGYADDIGVVQRIRTVFGMRGPIAQVLYRRNLTPLGVAYNPYGEESRGFGNGTDQ